MAQADTITENNVIVVDGEWYAVVKVDIVTEDETWVFIREVNGTEFEFRAGDDVEVVEDHCDPMDYIEDCYWCARPAHKCICP